jgi:hypothetical protein
MPRRPRGADATARGAVVDGLGPWLWPRPITDRLPASMADHQTGRNEKAVRAFVLPGTVVALIALIGVDCAVASRTVAERGHKSATIAVRSMAPAMMASRATTTRLVLAGATLLFLLLLSRHTSCLGQRSVAVQPSGATHAWRPLLQRRKRSISYHIGGLYGP